MTFREYLSLHNIYYHNPGLKETMLSEHNLALPQFHDTRKIVRIHSSSVARAMSTLPLSITEWTCCLTALLQKLTSCYLEIVRRIMLALSFCVFFHSFDRWNVLLREFGCIIVRFLVFLLTLLVSLGAPTPCVMPLLTEGLEEQEIKWTNDTVYMQGSVLSVFTSNSRKISAERIFKRNGDYP